MNPRIFELSGNRLCLDFANTVEDRSSGAPHELLDSYVTLLSWSQQTKLVTDEEAQRLLEEARMHPAEAVAVLRRAIVWREIMYRIFAAVAGGISPAESDLCLLNAALVEIMVHACIKPREEGFIWDWVAKEHALDCMLWSVVRSAADVLTSEDVHAVRVCAADDCQWLFLDTSKNRSRRWCDMKSCGNRVKVRRHYEQKKAAGR